MLATGSAAGQPIGSAADAPVRSIDFSVDAPAEFAALRSTLWSQDGADYALLDGDVRFAVAGYAFRGERALVRIDRVPHPDEPELRVKHLSVVLDGAQNAGSLAVSAEAPRLLVTAATTGAVRIDTPLAETVDGPPRDALVADGYTRIAEHFAPTAQSVTPQAPPASAPDAVLSETDVPRPEAVVGPDAVLPVDGVVSWDADRFAFQPDVDGQAALSLQGSVRMIYEGRGSGAGAAGRRTVTLRAENAVLFLDAVDLRDTSTLEAAAVRGVYLEGGVTIGDGEYNVRAPRAYYDLIRDKAVLLEAVVYAWDARRSVPLYLRADVIRQTSQTSFEAEKAVLTTSEFGVPHFAIGAQRLTIERRESRPGFFTSRRGDDTPEAFQYVDARGTTLQWSRLPFFYWPRLAGDTRRGPLRRVQIGSTSDLGATVETEWDGFALLGRDAPDGVELIARADWNGEHGAALGAELTYDRPDQYGRVRAYGVPDEQGIDEIGGRRDIDRNGDFRGLVNLAHRQELFRGFELSAEANYVSDETFLEEYFSREATSVKAYETSLYLNRYADDWAATLLIKTDLNDFSAQTTTLQSPGYRVDKLPELGFYQVAKPLWGNRLTYFGESRVSVMSIEFSEDTPDDRGLRSRDALDVFGITADQSFADAARLDGLPTDNVTRLDSRHEVTMPLTVGGFDVTPYAAGRLTMYDSSFEGYRGEEDQVRLWGALGMRFGTSFTRTDRQAANDLLDVNGLRHIIEPSVDVFAQAATLDGRDLPVFDPDVEPISGRSGVKLGVRQAWQTQRGGPGQWRRVDWLVWDTQVVLTDDASGAETVLPRYFAYRPELVRGGNHAHTELRWLVTDALAANGELTYAFDADRQTDDLAQWRVGLTARPDPSFSAFVDYEEIAALDIALLSYGASLQLTEKYRLSLAQRLDFSENDSRTFAVGLTRKLPRWTFRVGAAIDEIDGETSVGFSLAPDGFGRGASLNVLDTRGGR